MFLNWGLETDFRFALPS